MKDYWWTRQFDKNPNVTLLQNSQYGMQKKKFYLNDFLWNLHAVELFTV